MKNFPHVLLLVLLAGGLYVFGSYISSPVVHSGERSITVRGTGEASVSPDIAELTVGVQTGRQTTAARAMEVLNERVDEIVNRLVATGVDKKNIATEYLWLNPAYDYYDGRQQEAGYEATQNVKITVRDISKVSTILDAAVAAGANQVQNVQFSVSEQNTTKDAARNQAIANAQSKAQTLADQLGVRLGKVLSFSESASGNAGYPVPMYDRSESGGGLGGATVPEGEQSLESTVTIQYQIH